MYYIVKKIRFQCNKPLCSQSRATLKTFLHNSRSICLMRVSGARLLKPHVHSVADQVQHKSCRSRGKCARMCVFSAVKKLRFSIGIEHCRARAFCFIVMMLMGECKEVCGARVELMHWVKECDIIGSVALVRVCWKQMGCN